MHVQPGLEPDAAGAPSRIVARRKRALVFVRLEEVWAFEAAERLAYVHTARGRFDVDLSLAAVEASFGRTLLRVHRKWLVNTEYVYELEGAGSETELEGLLSGLPLHEWMKVTITALKPHPNDPAAAQATSARAGASRS